MAEYEYVPEAISVAFFHGEQWFNCPHCNFTFEYFSAEYEADGIKKAGENDYICPKCNKKFRIS